MLHVVFQPQKVGLKINVATKVHVKKSCNKEHVARREPVAPAGCVLVCTKLGQQFAEDQA